LWNHPRGAIASINQDRDMFLRFVRTLLLGMTGAAVILLSSRLLPGAPFWEADKTVILGLLATSVAYVAALLVVALNSRSLFTNDQSSSTLSQRIMRVLLLSAMAWLPLLLSHLLARGFVAPDAELMLVLLIVVMLLLINSLIAPARLLWIGNLILLLVVAAPNAASLTDVLLAKRAGAGSAAAHFMPSSLYELKVSKVPVVSPRGSKRSRAGGGGIAKIDETTALSADDMGQFYLVTFTGELPDTRPLNNLVSPFNLQAYRVGNKQDKGRNFRVTDLLLDPAGTQGKHSIFLSYHHWDSEQSCLSLRVDEAAIDLGALDKPVEWENRFRSFPCLPAKWLTNETGGRLALFDSDRLLVTVGISYAAEEYWDVAAKDDYAYGKIIELDRNTWESKILSKGHRNPQGLLVDGDTIWSTEHGPAGGDELNLIVAGSDYGWPYSSYGTDYNRPTLKGSDTPGEHASGMRPVYAWVPSIGISSLIKIEGEQFRLWNDDLLIGSLRSRNDGYSIFRVRLHDKSVQFVEHVRTGLPVRDLIQMKNGLIIIWDGNNNLQVISAVSDVFTQCKSCHAISKDALQDPDTFQDAKSGPNLYGVINRSVGGLDHYEYSAALESLGGRWTPERLDAFLQDPQATAPGTSMAFAGIEDPHTRQEIIDMIEALSN
jgi:glucose/arabinose dehydrogenase